MMSIEECRKYLPDKSLTDEQVEKIRDEVQGLAQLAVEMYIKSKLKKT